MKILIIEVNWLGDVLFSTAAIKALADKFPASHIACLVVPRVKEVLEDNPYVSEIIINDEDGLHKDLYGKFRLAKELKEKKFDLAVFFHRSFSRTAVVWFAGVPKRVGYNTFKRWFLLSKRIPLPRKDSLHRVNYYLNIVKCLGCDTQNRYYEFFTSQGDDAFAESFLAAERITKDDFMVCLNPGGNWLPKRWPAENFGYLADKLVEKYKAKVIFTGSSKDLALVAQAQAVMKTPSFPAAGKMTLKQSAALFKKSSLVISADSGPLHIASSVGANVIGLFGPTSPEITGPIGKGKIKVIRKEKNCIVPCYKKDCVDNNCMRKIKVEDVLEAVNDYEDYIHHS